MTSIDNLQAFRTSASFQALSGKQREYVLAYIECEQDKEATAKRVWPDSKYPKADGHQVFINPKVQRAIKLYYNIEDEELNKHQFLVQLSNEIRQGDSSDKVKELYAKMKGWLTDPKPDDPTEKPDDNYPEFDDTRGN